MKALRIRTIGCAALSSVAAVALVGAFAFVQPASASGGTLQSGSTVSLGSFTATLPANCSNVDPTLDCTFNVTGGTNPTTVEIVGSGTFVSGTSYTITSPTVTATINDSVLGTCTLTLTGNRGFTFSSPNSYLLSSTVGSYTFGSNCSALSKAAIVLAIGSSPSTSSFNADWQIS